MSEINEVPIGDFCQTGSGGTPSRSKASRYFGGSIPWVKSGELRESVITETEEYITEVGLAESSAKLLPANALLVALYGATVGRIGVLGIEAATNQAVCYIIPNERRADRKYLYYALQSKVPTWLSQRVGGGQPNISQGIIKDTKIPLPPLSEQKRIADILDKADTIRRKRQAAILEIERLSVSTYLHRFGYPTNAVNTVSLGECVTILSGGTPSKSNDDYWNGNFPWVSPKDMKVDYIIEAEDHVTDLAFRDTTLKKLPIETILIVVRGMILAHTVPVAITDLPVAINQDMKALIASDGYDPYFICWSLKAAHNYILGKVATAAHGTKRLEVEHITSLPIPKVPLSEQKDFAKAIQQIRLTRKRLASPEINSLFDSLVHLAFKGEL